MEGVARMTYAYHALLDLPLPPAIGEAVITSEVGGTGTATEAPAVAATIAGEAPAVAATIESEAM
jgi:hypothetical protein